MYRNKNKQHNGTQYSEKKIQKIFDVLQYHIDNPFLSNIKD